MTVDGRLSRRDFLRLRTTELQSFTAALLTIYWRPSNRICVMCGCCGCSMPSGWNSIEGAPRIEAAISAFRARGGVVETEERNVGASAPAPSWHPGS